jgi:hypothetical protein
LFPLELRSLVTSGLWVGSGWFLVSWKLWTIPSPLLLQLELGIRSFLGVVVVVFYVLVESAIERSSRAHGLRWCSRFFGHRNSSAPLPIGVSGIMVELRLL